MKSYLTHLVVNLPSYSLAMLVLWETYSEDQARSWVMRGYSLPKTPQILRVPTCMVRKHSTLLPNSRNTPRGSLDLCGYLTSSILWGILVDYLYTWLVIKCALTNQVLSVLDYFRICWNHQIKEKARVKAKCFPSSPRETLIWRKVPVVQSEIKGHVYHRKSEMWASNAAVTSTNFMRKEGQATFW
jgi:hypothetical protein